MSATSSTLIVATIEPPILVGHDEVGAPTFNKHPSALFVGMINASGAYGETLWVCAATSPDEQAIASITASGRWSAADLAADIRGADLDLILLDTDVAEFEHQRNIISRRTLWALLHRELDLTREPTFDSTWRGAWRAHRRLCQQFAQTIASEAAPGAIVVVADHALLLVPGMLRMLRPDLLIASFIFTPWITSSELSVLPADVAAELLDSLLAADQVGFQTSLWAERYAKCCLDLRGRHPGSAARVFPLAIDVDEISPKTQLPQVRSFISGLGDASTRPLILGRVDRRDRASNTVRGLLAYGELLRQWPEWRERVQLVTAMFPGAEDEKFSDIEALILGVARDLVTEFGTAEWSPINISLSVDYLRSLAIMCTSDVFISTPLIDGMSVVVLETVVINNRDAPLVLSTESGAANRFTGSVNEVNAFDVSQTAEAMNRALNQDNAQRAAIAHHLRDVMSPATPTSWFADQLVSVSVSSAAPEHRSDVSGENNS